MHVEVNKANNDPFTKRISIDTKATVQIGEYSRGGKSRGTVAVKAIDHDFVSKVQLKPFGVMDTKDGILDMIFGRSYETSDFIVDNLEIWYYKHKVELESSKIKTLLINLDNGPCQRSNCGWFLYRILKFAKMTGLFIKCCYYPPYHSKYNPVERGWGALERYRNGILLDSEEMAYGCARGMTRQGNHPIVHKNSNIYEKGNKVEKKQLAIYESMITRHATLGKRFFEVNPNMVVL